MDIQNLGNKLMIAGAVVMVAAPATLVLGQSIAQRVKTTRRPNLKAIKHTATVLLTNHS